MQRDEHNARIATEADRILHSHHEGVVCIGERHLTRRYVMDPATCRPVVALPPEIADDVPQVVLSVPDDSEPAIEVLATHKRIDRRTHAAADRFLIYHGEPEDRALFLLDIETARCHAGLVSGDEIAAPDPLHDAEPELCLEMNSDPARLARACGAGSKVRPAEPVMVGIDRYGFDVRARFGIVRVEFAAPVSDEEGARRAIEDLSR